MPRARRIVDTGTPMRKLDPDEVAKALGAEPIPPSKAMLQMSVMDLEFEGPMSSFDALCQALAEKHKVHVDVVKTVMFSGVRTKTPRGSAVKQPWEDAEDVEDEGEEPDLSMLVPADPNDKTIPLRDTLREWEKPGWDAMIEDMERENAEARSRKAIPEREDSTPELPKELPKSPKKHDPVPESSRSGMPEEPLSKCPYGERYREQWMKWFEQGKADKTTGTPKNYDVIPKWMPEHEVLKDYAKHDKPLFPWQSAYDQGYDNRTGDFIHVGLLVPTEKARGLSWDEVWNKQDKSLTETY